MIEKIYIAKKVISELLIKDKKICSISFIKRA